MKAFNLSKALNILTHKLILAKLKVYVLQPTAPKQMENYLTDLIFLNDLFLQQEETFLINYSGNTLYSISKAIESAKKVLSKDFRIIEN